ncbi:MAG: adenylate/guanylate cyclase domain-containing protein [Hyphomicrobium sp.]
MVAAVRRLRPSFHVLLTSAVLALAVVLRIWDPSPVARLRMSIFDSYLALKPRATDPDYPVRIIAIDEASLARIGQWPWPRSDLATMIERLTAAGAKTISLDLILAEPDRLSPEALARQSRSRPDLAPLLNALASEPSNDERLASAIAKGPVILGLAASPRGNKNPLPEPHARLAAAGDDPKLFVPAFAGGIASLPVLSKNASGEGAVNWLPDKDQIVRHVPLMLALDGTLYPSLALEALRVGDKETTLFVRSSGGSGILSFGQLTGLDTVRVGSTVLPSGPDGQLWLNFATADPKRFIPAYRILDETFDPKDIAGRHILVGATASGLLDLRATPLEASVPGVEIHAQALEQMLSGEHLVRPSLATGAELIFLVAAGALVAWLIQRSGPVIAAANGIAALAAVSTGSWLAFANAGYLFDPVYASIALLAIYLAGSLLNYVRTETDRARVRQAFSHYVSAPLVDELARNPARLKLGGETRDVTLLFADVRGFSRLSEGMDAEALIRFINELFTPLSEIILENRGTIDKFMGDAVMAFWNAPVPDPSHAANACRTALAMQARLAEMNRAEAAQAAANGVAPRPIRIGIGLNTGACCVGNVGSPQRFDYSVLGDPVNTASRLEETTKIYGMAIIVGERTAREAAHFAFLEIATTGMLRGKDKAERLFALLGDETLAATARFKELERCYAEATHAMRTGDPDSTTKGLGTVSALGWPDLEPLIAHYTSKSGPER